MLLRMSTLFVRTLREDPADAEVPSHRLLVRAGYIRRAAPGIYTWLPLGLKVLAKVEQVIREEMDAIGAQEVHFPALLPREPYERTGRWTEYGPNLFRLHDRRENDYLLAPTHEEMFTLLVKDLYSSYKDLPLALYQIQTKYRDEARPRAGLLRGREFVMKDAYSFDVDDAGLDAAYLRQREAYQRIFTRLGLDYVVVAAMSGAMGGSRSEEFLMPTPVGEDTFVRSPGGYAANVEAVTTPVPAPVPFDDAPDAHVEDTPDTPTIESLVAAANERFARPDRPWTAADTLKNVVVAVVAPDGTRELVVVGVPGDREVDMTRLEAALAPASVEAAGEADFAAHPELVKGYIGPTVLGVANTGRPDAVRYLLDPRVVPGTRWITGANEPGRHVFDLVAGRDFAADGAVEAAEIRAGDPAPDGSGPLELARGIEIGHIFALGRKYADALGLSVLDENGKAVTVTMGSYGIGVSRAVAALAETNHDGAGLAWPASVAPAHVHLVAAGKDEAVRTACEELAADLQGQGVEVLYDDRPRVSPGVKFADAELLGLPIIVTVGRSLADGVVEVRLRRPQDAGLAVGERPEAERVPVGDAAARIGALVAALVEG
ncbi:proline--tRNA ligase [Isoptericola sp. b441]|uniref:Proline--tRNA ligase n=1 Tax=Actinotalea lenta TaxID=3064654 RepID=A0ABT9D8Y8_9CELL|nr:MULTISPECIES: proline--tRNA ligase [unclassified Isoptericola]MDO8107356.1 proline--tRNA ligase [Isoptericola sp. b441]MDO8120981.1 proline--tRNA ligase [Isoptericola sp. b490]